MTDCTLSDSLHKYMQKSTLRKLVDTKLSANGTDLEAFLANGRDAGKSLEEIWIELRRTTGIPVAVRTLYRWADDQRERAS